MNLKGRENDFRNIAIELIRRFQNDVGEVFLFPALHECICSVILEVKKKKKLLALTHKEKFLCNAPNPGTTPCVNPEGASYKHMETKTYTFYYFCY